MSLQNHYSHYVEYLPPFQLTHEPTEYIILSTFHPTIVIAKRIEYSSSYSVEFISIIVGVSFATSVFATICLALAGAFGSRFRPRFLRGAHFPTCLSDASSVDLHSSADFGISVDLQSSVDLQPDATPQTNADNDFEDDWV